MAVVAQQWPINRYMVIWTKPIICTYKGNRKTKSEPKCFRFPDWNIAETCQKKTKRGEGRKRERAKVCEESSGYS